jgi:hypothetical protein
MGCITSRVSSASDIFRLLLERCLIYSRRSTAFSHQSRLYSEHMRVLHFQMILSAHGIKNRKRKIDAPFGVKPSHFYRGEFTLWLHGNDAASMQ